MLSTAQLPLPDLPKTRETLLRHVMCKVYTRLCCLPRSREELQLYNAIWQYQYYTTVYCAPKYVTRNYICWSTQHRHNTPTPSNKVSEHSAFCRFSHNDELYRTCGRDIAQAVSRWLFTAETWVRSQGSPCGIYGGQNNTGTGFPPSPSVYLCQYHSTDVPYSLMYHLGDGQWAR
jgi:hypothetical protein